MVECVVDFLAKLFQLGNWICVHAPTVEQFRHLANSDQVFVRATIVQSPNSSNPQIRFLPAVTEPWLNVASLFTEEGAAVSIHIVKDGPMTMRAVVISKTREGGDIIRGNISNVPFQPATWVKMRLDIGRDRVSRLYQQTNEKEGWRLISQVHLGDVYKLGNERWPCRRSIRRS